MNVSKLSTNEILFQSGLRINNTLSDPTILSAVSPFGYTAEKMNEGAALLAEATTLTESQKREYGEVDEAQAECDSLKEKAHGMYMDMLAICKIAFKKDVKAITTLELSGRRAGTLSGWLNQTTSFYRAILANESWKAKLATFGQSEEILNAQLAAVEAVATALENKRKEMGDAQNATKLRDEKLEALGEWVNDYEVIARIALADQPQLLEKLGIVVKA